MKTTDIIRSVLDLIDSVGTQETTNSPEETATAHTTKNDDEPARFRQILAMIQADKEGEYSNTPNEIVAPIDSVTTHAGGGWNRPKHPEDIRVKDPRGY